MNKRRAQTLDRTPSSALRLATFVFSFCALGTLITLVGTSPAAAQDAEPDCSGVFAGYGACEGVGPPGDDDGGTVDVVDPAVERAQALAAAKALVYAQIEKPEWQIWPDADHKQVVELTTFFYITKNWDTHFESVTVGTQTVWVSATPKRSHWTWDQAVGGPIPIVCDNPGTQWSPGLRSTDCGYTPRHSSSITGDIQFSARVEYEITSSTGLREVRFTEPTDDHTLCVGEVLAHLTEDGSSALGPACDDDRDRDDDTGTETVVIGDDDDDENDDDRELPVRTLICSGWIEFSGTLFGIDAGAGGGVEFILKEFPDGTRTLTIAGEEGGAIGVGLAPVGAGVRVGDSAIGAYFKADAAVWGTVGGGLEFEIPSGQSVPDFLGDLLVGTAASPITGPLNTIIPGGDPIPTGPKPSAVFGDVTVTEAGGAEAVAGFGFVAATASADAEISSNYALKLHDDGRVSKIITHSGEIGAQASYGDGVPFYDWNNANVGAVAQGSVSVETIYEDGIEVETIVTISYGTDADVVGFDGEDDPLTITTQQWRYDLTDPAVAEAIGSLDDWATGPGPGLINGELPPTFAELSEFGTSTGPLTQTLTETQLDGGTAGGILIAGADAAFDIGCQELS